MFNNQRIDNVTSYCYLGSVFSASGNVKATCKRMSNQALNALFKLSTIGIRNNFITAIKLFNILMYCG
jgi:hypothetical protein